MNNNKLRITNQNKRITNDRTDVSLKRKAEQSGEERPKKRIETEAFWENYNNCEGDFYLGELYMEVEHWDSFRDCDKWSQKWNVPKLPNCVQMLPLFSLNRSLYYFPKRKNVEPIQKSVNKRESNMLKEIDFKLISKYFDNNQYKNAENELKKILETKRYIKKELNIELLYLLAKAYLMQAEGDLQRKKTSEAEFTLDQAMTLKCLKNFARASALCDFYLELSKDCLNKSRYSLAIVIANEGVNIRHSGFVKGDLYIVLVKAHLLQMNNKKAIKIAIEGLNSNYASIESKNALKSLISNSD